MTAQIAQITGLKALQLYDFPHSFTKSMSHGLPNLQELVSNGVGPVLDVQHCTQLTSLTVADGADITGLKQVHLPAGQTCCLEQLSVDIFSEEGAGYTLSNLDVPSSCPLLLFVDRIHAICLMCKTLAQHLLAAVLLGLGLL